MFIKFFKSNIFFIITLVILAVVAFSPDAKAILMRGVMSTGILSPDVSQVAGEAKEPGNPSGETPAAPLVESVSFTSADGRTIDLARLKGKVVFLNFWTTWCPPCIAEMPSINRLYEKLKENKDLVFVLADADGKLERSTAFMKKKNFALPVYIPASPIPAQLFRGSLPTTVIINKNGRIVFAHEGMADYNTPEMEKALKDLAK